MIELTLQDMTCGHCIQVVTQTVHAVDPDAKLDIDLPTHQVKIASERPVEAFKQALAAEGYPAS